MDTYGSWTERITIDGELFLADRVDESNAVRAGVSHILALRGLPERFEDSLIRAAQVCDVPHTWRVRECTSESEVNDELLARGREVLVRDRTQLGVTIVTYLGFIDGVESGYTFLAAGAIRNKLSKTFLNEEFPVVSRAIVSPAFRGKGLGSLIVEHRMKAVMRGFYSIPPKAIHFGTESEKILTAIKKVEQDERVSFAYIGDEQYTTSDGTYTVRDYLCYLPSYQDTLLSACRRLLDASDSPDAVVRFEAQLKDFMCGGVSKVLGKDLSDLFQVVEQSVTNTGNSTGDLAVIREVFQIRSVIGAEDPRNPHSSGR